MSEYESLQQELVALKQRVTQLEQSIVADSEPVAQSPILEPIEICMTAPVASFEAVQQTEALTLEVERSRVITSVIERIWQTLDIPTIFWATTHEVRHILHCDRVALYQYNADWGGDFVYESVGEGWIPLAEDDRQP